MPTAAGWSLFSGNPVLGAELGVIFDVSLLGPSSSHPYYRMWNSWKSDTKGRPINSIGYSKSSDGFQWNSMESVLAPSPDEKSWEHVINRPSVIHRSSLSQSEKQSQQEYQMWYTGQSSSQSFIGHASSADGIVWQRTSESPVLSPDSNSWEKQAIMCPNVVFHESSSSSSSSPIGPYRLYYSAGEQLEPDAIGLAFSEDGRVWSKCTENPIFRPDTNLPWEAAKVTGCHVFYDSIDEYWYMFYIGFADVNTACVNLARSKDGISNWLRHPDNPIISRDKDDQSSWIRDAVYKPFALFDAERDLWLLWFNGCRADIEEIGLATKKGHDLGFDK